MDLLLIFFTGLTTGGLSCLAVQGGLLASVIANQKEQELETKKARKKTVTLTALTKFDQLDWLPVILFLVTKLIAHTVLGFFLGALGSAITLTLPIKLAFQAFGAFFMIASALNLLNAHPLLRYLSFQPPRFLRRLVKNTSKSKALFTPAILGFMTIFIPCGITQAMEVLAISSGNPFTGALIMFSFTLGTSPLFALLGVATAKLSETWHTIFNKVAAFFLIAMAIYSLNGVMVVLNSPVSLNNIFAPIANILSQSESNEPINYQTNTGPQKVTITVLNEGYRPNKIRVKQNQPVDLTLVSNDVYSCALAFVFKEFGIDTFLKSTDTQTYSFTPTRKGTYQFTCSMGMYSGTMEVI